MTDAERETYYDDVIAPKLLAIRDDCIKHGIQFLGVCEFAPGEIGRTLGMEHASFRFRMIDTLVRSGMNIDAFLFAMIRAAEKEGIDTSASIFLRREATDD